MMRWRGRTDRERRRGDDEGVEEVEDGRGECCDYYSQKEKLEEIDYCL